MGGNGISGREVRFHILGGADSSTSSQVIYSRLSDIFGRKILLVISITVFTVGNLLCGFSMNLAQLIAFRVIAGLGGGGIGVIVLIIISDISTLRTRGKVVSLDHDLMLDGGICRRRCGCRRRGRTAPRRNLHSAGFCILHQFLCRLIYSGDGFFGLRCQ